MVISNFHNYFYIEFKKFGAVFVTALTNIILD